MAKDYLFNKLLPWCAIGTGLYMFFGKNDAQYMPHLLGGGGLIILMLILGMGMRWFE